MSRYFTSPPPVYARNWANGQNLVESTKIERQDIVATKKVHRKVKKEKKKQKKEKSLKKQLYFPTKQVSDDSEQLEKSCLTEELHVGYLSDGSQNSKKRSREASPVVESQIKATTVAGNPLRIRFVFKKPKEAEAVVPPVVDRVCATSGTEKPIEVPSSVPIHDENLLSTSIESDKIEIPSASKKRRKHMSRKESRYSTLFDGWVPPCSSFEEDDSNCDDWLFGTRQQENASAKAIKNSEYMIMNLQTSGDSSSSFPRAQFLSDVGIFSLPYTVLF